MLRREHGDQLCGRGLLTRPGHGGSSGGRFVPMTAVASTPEVAPSFSLAGFGRVTTLSPIHKRRGSGARSLKSTEGLACRTGHASLRRTPIWNDRRKSLMKRSVLAVGTAAALLLVASASLAADGINLAWNDCAALGGVQNRTFACNVNTGITASHNLAGT